MSSKRRRNGKGIDGGKEKGLLLQFPCDFREGGGGKQRTQKIRARGEKSRQKGEKKPSPRLERERGNERNRPSLLKKVVDLHQNGPTTAGKKKKEKGVICYPKGETCLAVGGKSIGRKLT